MQALGAAKRVVDTDHIQPKGQCITLSDLGLTIQRTCITKTAMPLNASSAKLLLSLPLTVSSGADRGCRHGIDTGALQWVHGGNL